MTSRASHQGTNAKPILHTLTSLLRQHRGQFVPQLHDPLRNPAGQLDVQELGVAEPLVVFVFVRGGLVQDATRRRTIEEGGRVTCMRANK